MKKITALFLAILVLLQINTVFISAEDSGNSKYVITISNIDTSMLVREAPRFTTELRVNGYTVSSIKIIGEKWYRPEEFVIAAKDIPLTAGKYSYQLRIRTDGTLDFNNDLEIYYQGIDGRYKLNYLIDETDNHIMVVTGLFDNIITESPALSILPQKGKDMIRNNISDDSYFYQLDLRTKEGFTFENNLDFLFRSTPCVYSLGYMYELISSRQALTVNGSIGSDLEYFVSFINSKDDNEGFHEVGNAYGMIIDKLKEENSELLLRLKERSQALDIISCEDVSEKIETIVNRHQQIRSEIFEHIDVIDLASRVNNLFDRLAHH